MQPRTPFPPLERGPLSFPPLSKGGAGRVSRKRCRSRPADPCPSCPLTAPAHRAAARLPPISTTWSQHPSRRRPTSPCAPAPGSPSPHVRESTLAAFSPPRRPVARVPSEVVLPAWSNLRLRPPQYRPPELASFPKKLGSLDNRQVQKHRPISSQLQYDLDVVLCTHHHKNWVRSAHLRSRRLRRPRAGTRGRPEATRQGCRRKPQHRAPAQHLALVPPP